MSHFKLCTNCQREIPKTSPSCRYCHHKPIGAWNKHPERPTGTPGQKKGGPGRKPRNPDTPETDSAIDRLLAAAITQKAPTANDVPADGGFGVEKDGGALVLAWPHWNVRLELTPGERAVLLEALTAREVAEVGAA